MPILLYGNLYGNIAVRNAHALYAWFYATPLGAMLQHAACIRRKTSNNVCMYAYVFITANELYRKAQKFVNMRFTASLQARRELLSAPSQAQCIAQPSLSPSRL